MSVYTNFASKILHFFHRSTTINYSSKSQYVEWIKNPNHRGALPEGFFTIVYRNSFDQSLSRSAICKEMFMTIPTVIYTRKNFFLNDALSRNIEDFKSSGLIKHWIDKVMHKSYLLLKDEPHRPKVFQLRHLYGGFQVIIAGWFICSAVFMTEVLIDWLHKRNRQ